MTFALKSELWLFFPFFSFFFLQEGGSFESWSWEHYGAIFFVSSLIISMVAIVVRMEN